MLRLFVTCGKILVLVAAFFLFKFYREDYRNLVFFCFWQDGVGACFFSRHSFSIQTLIEKESENCFFPASDKILVLVAAFFYSNSSKKMKKLMCSAFGKVLVLEGAFFY